MEIMPVEEELSDAELDAIHAGHSSSVVCVDSKANTVCAC